MNGIKTILLIIIFLLLIPVGWAFQAGLTAEHTVLNSDYYHDLLNQTDITGDFHGMLEDRLFRDISDQLPENLANVVKAVMITVFDEEWLGEQILIIIDDLLLYIKGEQPSVQAVIDLREKKRKLADTLERSIAVLPDQLLYMMGFDPQALENSVMMIVDEMPLPDQVYVEELLAAEGTYPNVLTSLAKIRQFRILYAYLAPAALILLLLLNYLLAGAARAFKWFGAAVITAGISYFLALQTVMPLILGPLKTALNAESLLRPETVATVVAFSAARVTVIPLYFSLAGLLIALVGLVIGLFTKN